MSSNTVTENYFPAFRFKELSPLSVELLPLRTDSNLLSLVITDKNKTKVVRDYEVPARVDGVKDTLYEMRNDAEDICNILKERGYEVNFSDFHSDF